MNIKELQENWNEWGKQDALWAILTDPARKNGGWDVREFFETGRQEIADAIADIRSLPLELSYGACLDFGCGVGRLTQALCGYFEQCHGVDISPSMIDLANSYNRYPERCRYHVNGADDLRLFDDDSFDLVYSSIVLQHIRPEYSRNYIAEFIRVIKPGGLADFQLPSEFRSYLDQYRLPDAAFRARISVAEPFGRIEPGATRTVRVRVKNDSPVAWPAAVPTDGTCLIRLGNHWLDASGSVVVNDDGRAVLPRDLGPGDEVTIPLDITAPSEPGQYLLEFDLVQEMIAWFKNRGSPVASLPVRSAYGPAARVYRKLFGGSRGAPEPASPPSAAPERPSPVIDMYGIPKDEVLALVQEHGGKIVKVQPDNSCGGEWVSFRYYISKD